MKAILIDGPKELATKLRIAERAFKMSGKPDEEPARSEWIAEYLIDYSLTVTKSLDPWQQAIFI